MLAFLIATLIALPAAADERQALIVSVPEAPARITRATADDAGDGPPVILYAAENLTRRRARNSSPSWRSSSSRTAR